MASIDYLKLPAEIRAALLVAASNMIGPDKKRPDEPGSPKPAPVPEELFECVNTLVEYGRKAGFFVDP
jgi:DNA repair photolyase